MKIIFYNVCIQLKGDEKWAEKGFEIAKEQYVFEGVCNTEKTAINNLEAAKWRCKYRC